MSWSYALTRQTRDGQAMYGIREIYFKDDPGPEHPTGWSKDVLPPVGDTVTELLDEIRRYEEAAEFPRVFDVDLRQWVQVPPVEEEP